MKRSLENSVENGEKLTYWRSVETRKRTKDYIASIENEFAEGMTEISAMDRRSMLKVMGASIALSGLGVACRRPHEEILPYVKQPDSITPGIPNFFATAQPTPFGANGILVESHEGRPTKVEGNPSHPGSLGRASLINQAAALEIYDPDRSRFCIKDSAGDRIPAEWVEFDAFMGEHFFELKKKGGQGLALVFDSDLSPTALRIKNEIKANFPKVSFFVHEPMRQRNVEMAASTAFGDHRRVRYHLDRAKVIASIFCDPFAFGPEHLRHMRGYGQNREVFNTADVKNMNRVYAVEADYTLAGTNADHRLRLPAGLAISFVKALAYELHANHGIDVASGIAKAKSLANLVSRPPSFRGIDRKFLTVLAKDLVANKGQCVILGGNHLHKDVLALIHVLNVALSNYGKTFEVMEVDDKDAIAHINEKDLTALADELKHGRVDTLMLFGVNPVYDAKHLDFKNLLKKAAVSIHVSQVDDETGSLCTWHVPQTHFLEHFSDTRSYDGLITIIQPLIKPLHNARSNLEIMTAMLGQRAKSLLDVVKETHRHRFLELDFDKKFKRAVHDGIIEGSGFKVLAAPSLDCDKIYAGFGALEARTPTKENLELIVNFDRKVLDGRFSNHSWLQELPDPVTKLNWGNALLISPKAAREFGIKSGVQKNAYVADVARITSNKTSLELPVFVMPGLNDYSMVTTLGYGRTKAGAVGDNVGVDVYGLIEDYASLVLQGVKFERTLKTFKLSSTQEQFAMNGDVIQEVDTLTLQGRDPARKTTVENYLKDPKAAQHVGLTKNLLVNEPGRKEKVPLQITKAWDYSEGNQWGMVIDLAKCTGCSACMVACQSENNVPVVGKEQVIRGRVMHWLRVDRYFVGDVNAPQAISQPVPCQHCENAACEPVCPVAATTHDKEGLNVMTYNRCIGTRYCGNNCPYKVRRFNYFDFSHSGDLYVPAKILERQKTLKMQRNPDVTVRYRGVMEKCTYCTQRIQEAKMAARREGKNYDNLPDGAVTPACAQTCPTQAITFGNINDPNARVTKQKSLDRNYSLLDLLNARPRTTYLSMLRNPHPDLVA